jgi:2-keto-4-pentenoate hydratase/2-oxohepta-3-ene-1,7-dioic acid hydratase in catechol pathway
MRIARFVHPASSTSPAGVAWGVVEGPPTAGRDGLTVAAINGHPFETIDFTGDRWALSDLRLLAPILPSKVVAVGKNYLDHVKEMGGDEAPEAPILFLKPSTSVIGDGDFIRLPPDTNLVHHEVELAAVIGRPARDVAPEDALSHVFGYTIANDVSARDQQAADGQWARAKGHDSFCPLGPWIETELDPSDLQLTCHVNGERRQDSRTSLLIHSLPDLIAYMSAVMTLLPGDVVITGTPAGVGPIVAGDTVTLGIEGIGVLSNPVRMK